MRYPYLVGEWILLARSWGEQFGGIILQAHGVRSYIGSMLTLVTVLERLTSAPHCRKFVDVWQQWRGVKMVPERSDIDPVMLGASMAAISILQVRAPDQIIRRMSGSAIVEFTGRRRDGENMVDLAPPEQREERILRHQNMINVPCGAWLAREAVGNTGAVGTLEAILLPVSNDKAPDQPFIYIGQDIRKSDRWELDEVSTDIELARDFEYIDIGAGVPMDSP